MCVCAVVTIAGQPALGLICGMAAGALAGLCTGLGFYDKAARVCGAGLFVPITGFSNAVTSPAIEARCEGAVNGVGSEIFKIAGPVIVYGNIPSVVYGVRREIISHASAFLPK